MSDCAHRNLFWYLATNEDGWKCVDCDLKPGEPPGYSPAHDSSHLRVKVSNILDEMHTAGLVYVSNATEGEVLTDAVTFKLQQSGDWDQYSIVAAIMAERTPSHAAYWRQKSDAILEGNDKRPRCPCGALSTSTRLSKPPQYRCNAHWTLFDDETDDQLMSRIANKAAAAATKKEPTNAR